MYAMTIAEGFGRSGPPNRAVPCEPMAAAILAPAELPHNEYPIVLTSRFAAFRKMYEIAAARSAVATYPPCPARYCSTKALYPSLLISSAWGNPSCIEPT